MLGFWKHLNKILSTCFLTGSMIVVLVSVQKDPLILLWLSSGNILLYLILNDIFFNIFTKNKWKIIPKHKFIKRVFFTSVHYRLQFWCYISLKELSQSEHFSWGTSQSPGFKLFRADHQKQLSGGVLRNFAIFIGKQLCQRLFLNEVAGLQLC